MNSATSITAYRPSRVCRNGGHHRHHRHRHVRTSSADQFTYEAGPLYQAVSPTVGSSAGGTTVVITGTSFTGATASSSGRLLDQLHHQLGDPITAVSAAESAGTVYVTVTTPIGTSATSSADQYTYEGCDRYGGKPVQGTTAGGTAVTITGTNFTRATAVAFGTTAATSYAVVFDSDPGGEPGRDCGDRRRDGHDTGRYIGYLCC